jgi:MoaA/NifB/PqqE/SkfB family radical SAM enzyme
MSNIERVAWYYGAGRLFTPRPRYFCFNSTLRCDLQCIHCGIWKDRLDGDELNAGMLRDILYQPFFREIHTAWLTGGEPTLRQDAGELAEVMVEYLPSLKTLGLATNGVNTRRVMEAVREMQKAINGRGPSLFVHISLDGVGEVHDRIRRTHGAFEGVLATLDEVQAMANNSHAIAAGLNCVIQPENVDDLENIYRFAKDKGVTVTFNPVVITDQIYRTAGREDELGLAADQREKIISFLERIMN